VRLEVLGQLKKKLWLHRERSGDLPACQIVPQPTTLPRAPSKVVPVLNSLNTDPHFLDRGFSCRCVVRFMPRLLFSLVLGKANLETFLFALSHGAIFVRMFKRFKILTLEELFGS
jgi:hypothetical protein